MALTITLYTRLLGFINLITRAYIAIVTCTRCQIYVVMERLLLLKLCILLTITSRLPIIVNGKWIGVLNI